VNEKCEQVQSECGVLIRGSALLRGKQPETNEAQERSECWPLKELSPYYSIYWNQTTACIMV